jgi:hypothetical protein
LKSHTLSLWVANFDATFAPNFAQGIFNSAPVCGLPQDLPQEGREAQASHGRSKKNQRSNVPNFPSTSSI